MPPLTVVGGSIKITASRGLTLVNRYNTWEPDENIIDRRLIETFLEERFELSTSELCLNYTVV